MGLEQLLRDTKGSDVEACVRYLLTSTLSLVLEVMEMDLESESMGQLEGRIYVTIFTDSASIGDISPQMRRESTTECLVLALPIAALPTPRAEKAYLNNFHSLMVVFVEWGLKDMDMLDTSDSAFIPLLCRVRSVSMMGSMIPTFIAFRGDLA